MGLLPGIKLLALILLFAPRLIHASVRSDAISQTAIVQTAPIASTGPQVKAAVDAEAELKLGTELTRKGMLREALPHLLLAQSGGTNRYATAMNLGICYLGTGRYKQAIATLEGLRASGESTAATNNLLTQAYIGDGETQRAQKAFAEAASQTPKDEKLYALVADACTEHQDYEFGLQVVESGLQQLPDSARLHYERALFLGRLDRLEEARPEFERAAALAPGTYIAYLAAVQEKLYDDQYPEAIRLLREGTRAQRQGEKAASPVDYQMSSLLGSVLIKQGAAPGQPEFEEARQALEESAKERPDYSATQIELGKLYAMEGRFAEAVEHLEIGRRLEPNNPEVYASLSHAYLRLGDRVKARQCHAELTRLLEEKKSHLPPPPS
jgi:tetratricopeptide (TPR) repeat protein